MCAWRLRHTCWVCALQFCSPGMVDMHTLMGAQVGLLKALLPCVWHMCTAAGLWQGADATRCGCVQVGFLGTVALMVFGGGCAMAHAFTALK